MELGAGSFHLHSFNAPFLPKIEKTEFEESKSVEDRYRTDFTKLNYRVSYPLKIGAQGNTDRPPNSEFGQVNNSPIAGTTRQNSSPIDRHLPDKLSPKYPALDDYAATLEQTGKASNPLQDGQGMSYMAALDSAAVRGVVNGTVTDAMRSELARLERAGGPADELANVRINLGVTLMKHGRVSSPAASAGLYQECEGLFLAALRLEPEHAGALGNLLVLRRAWRWRTEGRYGINGPGPGGGGCEASSEGDGGGYYARTSESSSGDSELPGSGCGVRLETGTLPGLAPSTAILKVWHHKEVAE